MDLHIVTKGSPPFTIEIWYFDTVSEIKRKIHKSKGIPINRQTLFLNGQLLLDEHDTVHYHILQDSRIQLHVSPSDPSAVDAKPTIITTSSATDHQPQPQQTVQPPPPPSNKITIRVKNPKLNHHLSVEIDQNDTVSHLKEKIHELDGIAVNRLVLQSNSGSELHDSRTLRDYDLVDNSEITAGLRPQPVVTVVGGPSSTGSSSKKMKLLVLTKCGTKKVPVEVNAGDNVGELRKELQRMQQKLQFPLPQEGYFFIYKQNVMDDDQSFRWHHVGHGDTIEIFNGSVTGGS